MVELVLDEKGRTECGECGRNLHEHGKTRVNTENGRWHWTYHCKENYT